MWNKSQFESKMEGSLKGHYGPDEGEKWYSKYQEAKNYLIDNVYEQIRGTEPQMTDHGERHIANVLKNVHYLLQDQYETFSAINLYCLGIIVLFHDVGNIKGRKNHNENIAQIYNKTRNNKPEFNQERYCVLTAAKAHTGFNLHDGSTDTLKDVPRVDHLDGQKILLQELAAILRIADECAEGHQRTSDFMNQTEAYGSSNQPYHDYASITSVLIDSGEGRIVLTYHVEVTSEKIANGELNNLIHFILKRVCKLDIERRYCKHYADSLNRFKKTEASINFSFNGEPLNICWGPHVLTDRFPLPPSEADIDIENELEFNVEAKCEEIIRDLTAKIAASK
jgi:hypothetical protein